MKEWLRRWLGVNPCNRAKLTLLPDKAILGLPTSMNDETAYHAARQVKDYLDGGHRVLVFPFPVDVEDKR